MSTWSHTDISVPLLGNLRLELMQSTAADKVAVQQLIDAFTKHGRTAVRYVLSGSDAIVTYCESV